MLHTVAGVGEVIVVVGVVIGSGSGNCNSTVPRYRNSNSRRVSDFSGQDSIPLWCTVRHYILTLER